MSGLSVKYFVHSQCQTQKKEKGCHRLMASVNFSRCIMIGSDDAEMFTSEVHDPYARTTGA